MVACVYPLISSQNVCDSMPLPVLAKMFVHAAILLVTSRLFFGGFLFVHAAILLVTSRLFSGGFRVGDTFFFGP